MAFFPGQPRYKPSQAPASLSPTFPQQNRGPVSGTVMGGNDFSKLGAILGGGVGGIGGLGKLMNMFQGWDNVLTREEGENLIRGAGKRAFGNIFKQTARAKGDVASQYAARGLGSSGAVIGDIAGTEMQAAEAIGVTEAQLNQQLLGLLQYLDQRGMQQQMAERAERGGFFGDITEIGALLPFVL